MNYACIFQIILSNQTLSIQHLSKQTIWFCSWCPFCWGCWASSWCTMSANRPFCSPNNNHKWLACVVFEMGYYQWGLAQQLASPYQIANGHVEVSDATAPIGDSRERVCNQNVFCRRVNQTHSILVDGYQQLFWVACVTVLLHFKSISLPSIFKTCTHFDFEECRSKSWPFVQIFQKRYFSIFWTHILILNVEC